MNDSHPHHWARLRELPIAARLCIASFLISVGVGYFSALVQMHFQHADPGDALPKTKKVVKTFHGDDDPKSRLEALLVADENLPFNGGGQMSAGFTKRADGWNGEIKKKARALAKERGGEVSPEEGEKALREERAGERDALVAWVKAGATKEEYEADSFALPAALANIKITEGFVTNEHGVVTVKIKSLLDARCGRCHSPGGDVNAEKFPLDNHPALSKYTKVTTGPAMSVEKLAQTTHIHLLAFSMLYAITGLMLAMTSYPNLIKIPLACTPLLVQLFDIACWWLARLPGDTGVRFAELIPVTGAIVGLGLGLQILLTLFDLFGKWGKLVLVLLLAGAGVSGSVVAYKVIAPHMEAEKASVAEKK